jgi:hypothetical protein
MRRFIIAALVVCASGATPTLFAVDFRRGDVKGDSFVEIGDGIYYFFSAFVAARPRRALPPRTPILTVQP